MAITWAMLACGSPATSIDTADESVEFVRIASGSFEMGSQSNGSMRKTTLSSDYLLGRTEVPWSLWNRVRAWALEKGYEDLGPGNNGFNGDDEDHPVIAVTWWDAIHWCNARSEMEGKTPAYYSEPDFAQERVHRQGLGPVHLHRDADGYRLPTEAEWEYACRAGDTMSNPVATQEYAGWFAENANRNTHPSGALAPNAWGLFDMQGNAWEWCWDWSAPYGAAADPTGPPKGTARVLRGGSWMNPATHGDIAYRHALAPATLFYTLGFRLARNAE